MRVLILCTGNSCRSQMAHGFLQSFDKNIEVYSGGTEPAALAYIGTARITESGTANQLSFDMYCSKNPSGTKPCINAPIPIPIRM